MMSYSQAQVILGTLLGDASLFWMGTKYPRWTTRHCPAQRPYIDHLYEQLREFCASGPRCEPNLGYGTEIHVIMTTTQADLLHAWDLAYPGHKKTVNERWLSELDWEGVAYWFMDDGTNTKSKISPAGHLSFCTHGFSRDEVDLLVVFFQKRGIDCTVHHNWANRIEGKPGKQYHVLSVRQRSRDALIAKIRPFILPCLQYKIDVRPLYVDQQCVWCGGTYSANVRWKNARNRPRCPSPQCTRLAGLFSKMKYAGQLARFTSHPLFLSAKEKCGIALPIERELTMLMAS